MVKKYKVLDLFSGLGGFSLGLKGLGNSIVPQIVEEIGKALIKAERE